MLPESFILFIKGFLACIAYPRLLGDPQRQFLNIHLQVTKKEAIIRSLIHISYMETYIPKDQKVFCLVLWSPPLCCNQYILLYPPKLLSAYIKENTGKTCLSPTTSTYVKPTQRHFTLKVGGVQHVFVSILV